MEPFFYDLVGTLETFKSGRLSFTGQNVAEDKNILSIVLEIDAQRFLPDAMGMYAVVADLRTRGTKPAVIDTFGRPEVTNVILSDPGFDDINRTLDIRELFNRNDPFAGPGFYADVFRARFHTNLHRIDLLDGVVDWPLAEGVHPLTEMQLADYTVIDLAKPFGTGNWFEIERAVAEGRPHTTGGGRWLDDDMADIQFSSLIARDRTVIGDGVDRPTKPASRTFPYLNDPIR